MMEQYIEDYKNLNGKESGMIDPAVIMREIGSTVAPIAMSIGTNIATGGTLMEGLPFVDSGLSLDADLTSFSPAAVKNLTGPQVDALNKMPSLTGNNTLSTTDAMTALNVETPAEVSELGGLVGRDLSGGGFLGGPKGTFLKNLDITDPAGMQNFKGAFGGAVGNFGIQLLMGQDPVKAAKSAGAGAIGKVLGTAIGGPIGGFIGGALGSIIGGRVICNELMRQGLLTRKQVVLDYKFTRDYLSPTHVNGYHVWAVWMVKQMRKGKFVKFWKHVAGHRANEIAYIYGERDKPDYLGKVYRKILEPTCWVVGKFCKVTDWSVLYNKKEIQHG